MCASEVVPFSFKEQDVPLDKDDFLAQAALIILELEIVYGPTTFALGQICKEIFIFARRRFFIRNYLRPAIVELEDDILGLLPEFQRLICSQTIWVWGYAGRLVCKSNYIWIY